ncbi:hypothetical protein TNCV_596931 [Trichonephila clavipes]|nr:hypothetical protein TNCV_596931 [Trichonephila clavipes]
MPRPAKPTECFAIRWKQKIPILARSPPYVQPRRTVPCIWGPVQTGKARTPYSPAYLSKCAASDLISQIHPPHSNLYHASPEVCYNPTELRKLQVTLSKGFSKPSLSRA